MMWLVTDREDAVQISLIDFTGAGNPDPWYAANVLIFTKQTRLTMSPGLFSEIAAWPSEKKLAELEYIANTIPSSHEFCDYTFLIEGVTRAFTHQLVRTRTASFAQQTMRVLDVSTGRGWEYATGPSIENEVLYSMYSNAMDAISEIYKSLIKHGAKIEDARGILPTNILTNIVMKINMRNFVDLVKKRSSPRTQSEYRDVLEQMQYAVKKVHPWINLFIERDADKAIADLQAQFKQLKDRGMSDERHTHMTKLLDQLRAQI